MELNIHHVIGSLMKEVKQFGEITVIESKTRLQLKDAKIDQAQIQIHGSMQNVSNINLQLNQTFAIKESEEPITGCVILSDDTVIIADYCGSGKLMEYNYSGKHIRDIPVSDKPFDITAVGTDRIAVTYPNSEYLEIINARYHSVRKRVPCSIDCYGISYQDQKLYVVVDPQGILVMDLNGETLNTIGIKVSTVYSITTTRDRIYYANQDNDAVHCCSMTGQEIWVFKDPSIYTPRGITVDNNQNVFVAGLMSNCLTVIQHDGKNSKILLTDHNELRYPKAVYYNKETKIICLGNKTGSIAVYQVS